MDVVAIDVRGTDVPSTANVFAAVEQCLILLGALPAPLAKLRPASHSADAEATEDLPSKSQRKSSRIPCSRAKSVSFLSRLESCLLDLAPLIHHIAIVVGSLHRPAKVIFLEVGALWERNALTQMFAGLSSVEWLGVGSHAKVTILASSRDNLEAEYTSCLDEDEEADWLSSMDDFVLTLTLPMAPPDRIEANEEEGCGVALRANFIQPRKAKNQSRWLAIGTSVYCDEMLSPSASTELPPLMFSVGQSELDESIDESISSLCWYRLGQTLTPFTL